MWQTTVSGDTTPTQIIVVDGGTADGGDWREVGMSIVKQSDGNEGSRNKSEAR